MASPTSNTKQGCRHFINNLWHLISFKSSSCAIACGTLDIDGVKPPFALHPIKVDIQWWFARRLVWCYITSHMPNWLVSTLAVFSKPRSICMVILLAWVSMIPVVRPFSRLLLYDVHRGPARPRAMFPGWAVNQQLSKVSLSVWCQCVRCCGLSGCAYARYSLTRLVNNRALPQAQAQLL